MCPSVSVRNIGVIFDQEKHVNSVCKAALFHLKNIAKIREYLTVDSPKILVHAFVICRLDNCNSLLVRLPKELILKIAIYIQNCAARLVAQLPKAAHTSPILQKLHWLPVEQATAYMLCI